MLDMKDKNDYTTLEDFLGVSNSKVIYPITNDLIKRFNVFNGGLFNDIYDNTTKDNLQFHLNYLKKNYTRLKKRFSSNFKLSQLLHFFMFVVKYKINLYKLKRKKETEYVFAGFPKLKDSILDQD